MQDQKFAYNTLNRDIKEIRLIALQPCTDATAAIECKILNAKLVDEPRYEALSYMWGGEADPQIIKIDGKEHQIRHNLWLALIQLRPADEERIIWIDAVCINQEDIEERNHQVGFMSFIYSQAHHVIAWLGPETETSHEAMEFLNRLLDGTIPIVNCDRLPFNGKWDAVQQLCEMQYWGRLWIIQEVVL
ncbi:HET-domain-containing protein, partial [Stipitochalara longipes BDJ]